MEEPKSMPKASAMVRLSVGSNSGGADPSARHIVRLNNYDLPAPVCDYNGPCTALWHLTGGRMHRLQLGRIQLSRSDAAMPQMLMWLTALSVHPARAS